MGSEPLDHRAELTDWTSIELRPKEVPVPFEAEEPEAVNVPLMNNVDPVKAEGWDVTEAEKTQEISLAAVETRKEMAEVAAPLHDLLAEGARQYRESFEETLPLLKELNMETRSVIKRTMDFFRQPVWIPGRKEQVKEYRRGTLFVFDMFRFGGTFAMIFGGLFLALNYQSFWQIAAAKVAPLIDTPSLDMPIDGGFATTQTKGSASAGFLAYLPEVGPPVNTLIVPKLKITVPIVQPPTEALLQQNWDQVEKDIQDALVHGAVHYPGTARAGQAGNFFITMHSSNYPWIVSQYNTIGARLHELVPGDEYWVYYGGDKHRYVVKSTKEVSPSDVTVLDQPGDQRLSTLMTCTPVGTTLRRLIIVAEEVDPVTGVALKVGEKMTEPAQKLGVQSLPI